MKTQPANKSWAQDSHVRLRLPSDWPDIGQWCSGLCLSGQGSVPVSCVKISHTWMNDYRTYIQKSIHGSWSVQSSHSKDFRMSVSVSYLYQRLYNQFSPYRRMMKHQHQSINVKLHHEGLHHFGSGCSSLGCLQWEVSSVTSIWSESQLSKYHDGFQPNLISDIIPVHHWQGSHRQAPAQVWIQKCVICPGEQNQKASIPQTSAFK